MDEKESVYWSLEYIIVCTMVHDVRVQIGIYDEKDRYA